ncbi:MAG: hypothetical protein KDA05_03025, partial [Phycisphaerales bacterium]|nr:hypothetical protein [Phycisphaerales bacterium]
MMVQLVEVAQGVLHAALATPPIDPGAVQAAIEGAQHAAEAAGGHGGAVQGINWSIAEVFTAAGLAALVTLVAMEIILGIDNIIF